MYVNLKLPIHPAPSFSHWYPHICSLPLCLYFCSVLLNKMKLLRVQAQSLEILELKDCAPEIYPSHTHLCCPLQL